MIKIEFLRTWKLSVKISSTDSQKIKEVENMKELTQKEILKGLSTLITNDLNRLNNKTELNNTKLEYYFRLHNKKYNVQLTIEKK